MCLLVVVVWFEPFEQEESPEEIRQNIVGAVSPCNSVFVLDVLPRICVNDGIFLQMLVNSWQMSLQGALKAST